LIADDDSRLVDAWSRLLGRLNDDVVTSVGVPFVEELRLELNDYRRDAISSLLGHYQRVEDYRQVAHYEQLLHDALNFVPT
ncbi:MAG: hypothetical protein AAF125_06820, partial [Chloroflexota bacterium]